MAPTVFLYFYQYIAFNDNKTKKRGDVSELGHILDHIGIYVNEGGNRYVYKRIFASDNIPNYYPPADKNSLYKEMYIDEILFLPIDIDTFNKDRDNKFYGFRYLFSSSAHTTVSLGPDPLKLGVTTVQMTVEVQRVRYYIVDKLDIVIDKVCDPLYPPALFTIQDKSSKIGETLNSFVDRMVCKFNEFYIDKNV